MTKILSHLPIPKSAHINPIILCVVDVDVYNKGHPIIYAILSPIGLAWCKVSEINIVISSSFLSRNDPVVGGGAVLSCVVDHFTPVSVSIIVP